MTDFPERLTVLGVRPTDSTLSVELSRFVPPTADAIYWPAFERPSRGVLARAFLCNPPVALVVLLAQALRRYRYGSELPAAEAVPPVAQREHVELVELDVAPLDRVRRQGRFWTAAAWAITALVAVAVALLALRGDLLAVGVASVCPPLVLGYVLAHAGDHLQRQADRIATAAIDTARSEGHRQVVVVVRERLVPGVAERAKDRGVVVDERHVSAQLAAEPSGAPERQRR